MNARTTSRRLGAPLLAAALLGAGSAAAHAQAAPAFRLVQHDGSGRIVTVVSARGTTAQQLRRRGHRTVVAGGAVVRYRDGALFVLDPAHRRYSRIDLAARIAEVAAQQSLLDHGGTPEHVALPTGTPGAVSVAARPLAGRIRIAGLLAQGMVVRTGAVVERLWYAATLPAPPAALRSTLAKLGAGAVDSGAGAAGGIADQVLLRRERLVRGRWRRLLDTDAVTRVALPRLAPPRGYHAVAAPASRRTASVPALALPLGGGPIAQNPAVFAIYWGSAFTATPAFATRTNAFLGSIMNPGSPSSAYWAGMAQYGVHPKRFVGSVTFASNPFRTVGTWNFLDVDQIVYRAQLTAGAPAFWSTLGGEDPVNAVFVAASAVNASGWSGYHFWAPSLGALVGFPLNLFVRPAVPWVIVRVDDSGGLGSTTAADSATGSFSHELVEAASDPYPFSGWVDWTKQPVWSEGEIADICSQGTTSPFAAMTRVVPGGAVLSTYWSNTARACVPESRPTLSLFGIAPGGSVRQDRVFPSALAADPLDGNISSTVSWRDSVAGSLGTGATPSTAVHALSLGAHTLTATVTDSQGLTATASVSFTVFALPPAVSITAPAGGSNVGQGQTVALRGTALDPQDGRLIGTALVWRVDGAAVGTGEAAAASFASTGDHTVTLTARDAAGLSATASSIVHVVAGAPKVVITAPASGSYFPLGDTVPITFTASASDPQDGTLTGASVRWYDSYGTVVNAPLGQGASLPTTLVHRAADVTQNLVTTHTITVVATDADGHTATDSVVVGVGVILT
jgi:hypothetical protein